MAYALNSEKWDSIWIPDNVFPVMNPVRSQILLLSQIIPLYTKGLWIQGQTTSRIKGHYFTPCKHAGMFICTTHVENR